MEPIVSVAANILGVTHWQIKKSVSPFKYKALQILDESILGDFYKFSCW